MNVFNVETLLVYLKAIPADTMFQVGLGGCFTLNNVFDQLIFKPAYGVTATEMANQIESLVGREVISNTGARGQISRERTMVYFALDEKSVISPINQMFMTLLRAMDKQYRPIEVYLTPDPNQPSISHILKVPAIWWDSLSERHKRELAFESITKKLIGNWGMIPADHVVESLRIEEVEVQPSNP